MLNECCNSLILDLIIIVRLNCSIGLLDYVCNGFSFDNAKKRIADFGYAAISLALMGPLAFYWDKLKMNFWMLLEMTNIYKSGEWKKKSWLPIE